MYNIKKYVQKISFELWFEILILFLILIITTSAYFYYSSKKSLKLENLENQDLEIILSKPSLQSWQHIFIKRGDTLVNLLNKVKISTTTIYQINRLKIAKPCLNNLQPKNKLHILINKNHKLKILIYEINKLKFLLIINIKNGFKAKIVSRKLILKHQIVAAKIHTSFSTTANKIGIPARVISQFIDIFGDRVNFSKQIHPGAIFKIIYKAYFSNGKYVKTGNIIASTLVLKNKTYYAICYRAGNHVDYYTLHGHSLHSAFLRVPIKYSHISSKFDMARPHPILNIARPHKGVDLAAHSGTPIHAAADGYIIFRGRNGGYGKLITIKHGRHYSTRYAHLSRFSSKYHIRSYVKQGDIIGYVGQTGLTTGPHLHYEFRINGVPKNPITVKLPTASNIPRGAHKTYVKYAEKMKHKLDNYSNIPGIPG